MGGENQKGQKESEAIVKINHPKFSMAKRVQ